jgi:hypothetical protein
MKIIRDNELGGIMMIPLLVDWHVRRCNVKGCAEKPNTIIAGTSEQVPIYGLCEQHFQLGNRPGGATITLVFDDFDAFKQIEVSHDNPTPVPL